jgi:cytochrome c oxidase cbb3-type subunit III
MKSVKYKVSFLAPALLLLSAQKVSAAATVEELLNQPKVIGTFVICISVFVVLVLIFLWFSLNQFLADARKHGGFKFSFGNAFSGIFGNFNDAVPLERESEVMTDHEYDGIRELDNQLPGWWVNMFYMTIVFAVAYITWFHIMDGKLQEEEYDEEVAAAEVIKKAKVKEEGGGVMVDENTVTLLTDAGKLTAGKETFTNYCAACHGKEGQGLVGPNLTDEYWLHGGGIQNVFKSVKYGIPEKGMIAWQNQMTPAQIQEVASYILSIKGSNPPNPKAPQGDKYVEEAK